MLLQYKLSPCMGASRQIVAISQKCKSRCSIVYSNYFDVIVIIVIAIIIV